MRPPRRVNDPPTPDRTRRRLSPREREIAALVANGLGDATIAGHLGLSPNTVTLNVRRIRLRLALASRKDLVGWVNARRDPDDPSTRLRRIRDDTTA